MTKWTDEEIKQLQRVADSEEPWADAVAAYLDALKEVGEIE